MDFELDGLSAIVTGGSLGIGYAITAGLAAHGVNVAITGRDVERLHAAAGELSKPGGGRVLAIPCDMADRGAIKTAFADARSRLGKIDILVNNAGSSPPGAIADLTDKQWQSSFDVKLMGYVASAREVLPEMRERRWGRIVNIIGRGGDIPTPNYLLGAFNAALLHFTRALALDAARHNVLVNGISPGAVNTPRWQGIVDVRAKATGRPREEVEANWIASIPLGRAAEPVDVADLAVFLCSKRARHIAGSIINIDGGGAAGV